MRYSIALTAVLAGLGLASDVTDLKKDTLQGFVEEHDLSLIECKSWSSFFHSLLAQYPRHHITHATPTPLPQIIRS